jgi:threonine dehydrogenase-like Zn-dependent dehydrogenase
VLQVVATGICGSDIHGLAGATGRRESGQVMGHETVGRVVEVGADVDDDWLGALATVNPVVSCGSCAACLACEEQQCEQSWVLGVRPDVDGAFAERITVPARNVVRLPESMTPEHGALVEPLAVGYHALVRAAPRPDDTVLVIGGGPIGQAAALAARRVGVRRVLVSEPNPARASILQRLGVRVVDPGVAGRRGTAGAGGPAEHRHRRGRQRGHPADGAHAVAPGRAHRPGGDGLATARVRGLPPQRSGADGDRRVLLLR